MGMIEVAQATVTIIPTMKGAQQTITKEMTSTTETAAEKAGKSSGSKFSSNFGSSIKKGAKVIAAAVTATVAGVSALTASFFEAAKATAEFGDHIDKMSQKLGISSDAYQEWDFICQHSGTSMDSMKTAMTKLSTAAENGSDAFQKLGISAEDAAGMSREELWNATIKALTNVQDETERARIAQDLFGKGATELGALLNMSADEIEAMRKQAHDLGIVMSEEDVKAAAAFQDSLQNMQQSFQGLKNRMMAEFLPGITTIMDGLTLIFSGDGDGGVAKIKEGVGSISTKISEMLPSLVKTGGAILTSILNAITDNLPQIAPLAAEILITLADAIVTSLPTLLSTGVDILTELVKGIVDNGPTIMAKATSILGDFMTSMASKLPELLTTAAQLVTTLAGGIIDNAPQLINSAITAITNFITGITEHLPEVLEKGSGIVSALLDGISANAPKILETISKSMGDVVGAVGDAISEILSALTPYIPSITEIATKTTEKLPEIISAFKDLSKTVGDVIKEIVKAVAPYIPEITKMVETTVSKIPEIVKAFTDLLGQIGPIIDSVGDAIAKIGTALSDVVSSIGGSVATIVRSFADLNTSLSGPITSIGGLIESIGTAIGTVVTAIGTAVATVNESFAKVLDSLKGVIDSIGEGAKNAGEGFSSLADAIIKLVNQTGFFDLAATLTAVAAAVGDIARTGRDAGSAYTNIEKLVGTLSELSETDFGSMAADLQTVADKLYVVTLYTPTLKDTKASLDDLGKVKLKDLITQLETSETKIKSMTKAGIDEFPKLQKSITNAMKTAASDVMTKMLEMESAFSNKLSSIATNVTNTFTTIGSTITDKLTSAVTNAKTKIGEIESTFSSKLSAISTNVTNTFSTIATTITNQTKSAATSATTNMNSVESAVSNAMSKASTAISNNASTWSTIVSNAISACKNVLSGTSWNVPELKIPVKTPKFSVEGKWGFDDDGNVDKVPKIKVEWYRRAAELGALFSKPAIIGVGDAAQPELLIGEDTLYDKIKAAVTEISGLNQTINITAPQGLNASETARLVRNNSRQLLARMRGGV